MDGDLIVIFMGQRFASPAVLLFHLEHLSAVLEH